MAETIGGMRTVQAFRRAESPDEQLRPRLHDLELQAFWQTGPHRPLPFRFGYPDRQRKAHLLIMARRGLLAEELR